MRETGSGAEERSQPREEEREVGKSRYLDQIGDWR